MNITSSSWTWTSGLQLENKVKQLIHTKPLQRSSLILPSLDVYMHAYTGFDGLCGNDGESFMSIHWFLQNIISDMIYCLVIVR